MPPESHLRRHARLPFDVRMQVSWKDAGGRVRNLRARCLDLSVEGARLETDAPIPARACVYLHSARHGSLGAASVRYCVRHTLKYAIGLEFTESMPLAGVARRRRLAEIQTRAESGT